ncbi:DUF2957 domain-containing protein [Cupriavidus malaysiensis]|uniref:DUF2957 domain-containing protein n=1 Tax=Cupriavidus malaysiensis TaxID=367825 RepID=A0ABM6F043_9BURK|nr:DUF2957 domain-containing protein [Cupriavidus malaysiensis]AOZ04602.1 hypothetical protein BKK80_01140 [Cupriavidus malaysiensis]
MQRDTNPQHRSASTIATPGAARHGLAARAAALLAAAALCACGGGGDGGGGSTAASGSSGSNGGTSTAATTQDRLCPAAIDYSTPYIGGSGAGELVKVQLDTARMTWQVTFLDSSVPRKTGTVQPSRSDTSSGSNVMSGTLSQETGLPTDKLNQCAFRLNGASLDASKPARMFVGMGVAGGTIPGARIQYTGLPGTVNVPDTTFNYFQFIGFTQTETDLSKVAGYYNGLGFHEVPSQNFKQVSQDYTMALASNGSFSVCQNATGTCSQRGNNFVAQAASGTLLSNNYAGEVSPSIGTVQGRAYLIVGKLRGQLVPVMIRVGYANDNLSGSLLGGGPFGADDEIGIGMMAPASRIGVGSVNGEYVGVDSNFAYRTTALVDAAATMLDPFQASNASLATPYTLNYTQTVAGVVTTTRRDAAAGSGPFGKLVFTGGVFGFLEAQSSGPYFTIGAFVQ